VETVTFIYVVAGKSHNLSLRVTDGLVEVRPVAEALGLSWATQRRSVRPTADVPTLEAWLARTKVKDAALLKHFQDHIGAAIKARSTDAPIQPAAASVILIGQQLGSTDHFRKDASLGAGRIEPEMIDTVARSGALVLFVRPPPSVWDGSQSDIQRVTLDLGGYRSHTLQDLRKAHQEVLVGPQMVQRYPSNPLVQRKILPARMSVEDGALVTVPAHPQRFPWERA